MDEEAADIAAALECRRRRPRESLVARYTKFVYLENDTQEPTTSRPWPEGNR